MLQLAQELGNVSKACRIVGYSHQQFYEIRRTFQHGADGLIDRLPGAKGPHPNRVPAPVEEAILAHALEHPTHGAQRVADELMLRGIQVSSGGVRGVWIRNDLQTRHHRLLRLEETVRKRKRRSRPQRKADLGEAGCQVNTVRSTRVANLGSKSTKLNWDCTICVSCCSTIPESIAPQSREN